MVDDLDSSSAPVVEPPAPTVPADVAELVDARVDPIAPKLAEPTPPPPPVRDPPRRRTDLAPVTPWGWYLGIGLLVVGLVIVGYLEIRDRLVKDE
jgi:hypothetical protein